MKIESNSEKVSLELSEVVSMLMKMNNAAVLVVVVLVLVSAAAAAAVAVAEEEGGCTEEVTSFSACLEYVSNPPNNLTESASEKCCKAFFSGVESLCLCYLIREPTMLGFPLNTTRIMSLSSLCPSQTQTPASTSLAFLCSVSPSLPPLNGAPTTTTDQAIGNNSSESSGRRVPIVTGNGSSNNNGGSSNNGYSTSNAQTLNTFLLFQFVFIIVTLLNT